MNKTPSSPIYLDHNATTPVLPEALDQMLPFLRDNFGNPSSAHRLGQKARQAVEEARRTMADFIGAGSPDEIIFTSGGTEANNLALTGALRAAKAPKPTVLTSAIEHASVRNLLTHLVNQHRCATQEIPVDSNGVIDRKEAASKIKPGVALVTMMAANNETGVIQPISRVADEARGKGILVHTDAVQAGGKLKIDVDQWNIDLLTLSAHKFGGPKGVGVLYVRKGTRLNPMFFGGHQEKDRRAGTENVAAIVGMAAAARWQMANRASKGKTIEQLRNDLESEILKRVPKSFVNGRTAPRIANTANICFPCADSSALVMALDLKGISVSNGSACAAGSALPSHVLLAMGLPQDLAHSCVRFSLGITHTQTDIEGVVQTVAACVEKLRKINPLW